ncbi:MAG: nitrilase-related carbon-nitrogen hydrolase [bacterium]
MSTVRIGVAFAADVLNQSQYAATLSSLDILLFPELLDGGYGALKHGSRPHLPHDAFLSSFQNASRRFSCTIAAGSTFFHHQTTRPTNTNIVFHNGKLIHRYDKIHLFPPTGDLKYFGAGKLKAKTFSLSHGRTRLQVGVVICYDLRFPELIRAHALPGMQLLLVPARWPRARDDAWQSLLKARAIENQMFVVGCNANDNEGGYSYAFDPMGRMIFSNRRAPKKQLHSFEIDLAALAAAQKIHRNLHDAVFLKATYNL